MIHSKIFTKIEMLTILATVTDGLMISMAVTWCYTSVIYSVVSQQKQSMMMDDDAMDDDGIDDW